MTSFGYTVFQAERPLAQQGFDLFEGMNRQSARGRDIGLAGRERVRITFATHDELCAGAADPLDLGRRGDGRHEDRGWYPEPGRRIGHGGAMIATRCRYNTCGRHVA